MKVLIVKKKNLDIKEQLNILKKHDIEIVSQNPDYIIAFGGDGTILKALKDALKYRCSIIPINFGKIGYMAGIEKHEFEETIELLKKEKLSFYNHKLLEVDLDNSKHLCLNDIVFKSEKLTEIKLFHENTNITKYRGDGLVISTPTGSTAYGLSAGGSIIHPDIDALNIVAICSQYLGYRPIILPNIKLRIETNANIYLDGIKSKKAKHIFVKLSNKYVKIAKPNISYYEILNKKLGWSGSKW